MTTKDSRRKKLPSFNWPNCIKTKSGPISCATSASLPRADGYTVVTIRNAASLADVVRDSRSLMEHLAKAKTAKLSTFIHRYWGDPLYSNQTMLASIVRTLLDLFTDIPGSGTVQIEVTKENIEWAKSEKRIFLKQNLETRLVSLFV